MSTARLILENKLGQKVRTFDVESDEVVLIYRLDNRRVEAHANLLALDEEGVEYQVLKKVAIASLRKSSVALVGLGRLRIADGNLSPVSPAHELRQDEDDQQLVLLMKKTAVGHAIAVALLIVLSIALNYFNKKEETQLVTIVVPKKEEPKPMPEPVKHVKVSEKKIIPQKTKIKKVAEKTVIKPPTVKHAKVVAKKAPTPVVRKQAIVVRNDRPQNLQNVGALAALGGLKNGTRGYEGLDANSLKNIRSAGVGSGGGGVGGAGRGGMKGVLPGSGLIAGSAGEGGRAQSAGGYGTRGQGGGRAGYGKISLVGSTGGISLPLDEEASIQGGLDMDQIQAVINRNMGQILYCYEKGLQGNPGLSGRVTVDFVIGANGRVSRARVAQSSAASPSVESCMIAKLRNWQFPRPQGGVNVDVQYPFGLNRVNRVAGGQE